MKSKAELIDRWAGYLQVAIEEIPGQYEDYNDPEENDQGDYNPTLYSLYRCIAVLEYLLNHNAEGFKENLRKAAPFMMELFRRYDQGELIHPSQVSMAQFGELLDALASGDMSLVQEYARHMGGRPEAEEACDDEFTLSLGYSLKYAVENDSEALKIWLPRLKTFCENLMHHTSRLKGYPLVLEALLERNIEKGNIAFKVLLDDHKKKCKSSNTPEYGPDFYDHPDADVFVWGIGLMNLCRYYGLDIRISDPLIPEELLISVKNTVHDVQRA